ncbi:hypothetical protein SP39_15 [Salmonella phage 39]|nr:hypothetical protein SP39_15 [Salmonella phage 39]
MFEKRRTKLLIRKLQRSYERQRYGSSRRVAAAECACALRTT